MAQEKPTTVLHIWKDYLHLHTEKIKRHILLTTDLNSKDNRTAINGFPEHKIAL